MDIYTKRNREINYNETQIEENNPIREYVQKIKMLLFTKKGDIYGNFSFGLDLERLLFSKNLSNKKIQAEIIDQISKHCPEFQTYKTDVEVFFIKYPNREECQIDILINNIKVISLNS